MVVANVCVGTKVLVGTKVRSVVDASLMGACVGSFVVSTSIGTLMDVFLGAYVVTTFVGVVLVSSKVSVGATDGIFETVGKYMGAMVAVGTMDNAGMVGAFLRSAFVGAFVVAFGKFVAPGVVAAFVGGCFCWCSCRRCRYGG